MQIIREEVPTGGPSRTRREEIVTLVTGREVEPEILFDFSASEGWLWKSRPGVCTWDVQVGAMRQFVTPFASLDSQAAREQAGGGDAKGGVYGFGFHNSYLRVGEGEDDGDLSTLNFQRKMEAFLRTYGKNGKPCGRTQIMEAIAAADEHFMGEFGNKPREDRPVRARTVWTDGALDDADKFRAYLESAKLSKDGYGEHGEWDEVWGIAILGEEGGAGHAAYEQYVEIAKSHPWVHPYYFEDVVNAAEIAEDMAVAVVPQGV